MEGAFRTPGNLTREHLSSGVASATRSAVQVLLTAIVAIAGIGRRACRRGAGVSGVRQTTARHDLTLTREPHCDCGTRFVFEITEADRAAPIPRHPAARPRA